MMIFDHLQEIKRRLLWIIAIFFAFFLLFFVLGSDALLQEVLLYLRRFSLDTSLSFSFIFKTLPEAFFARMSLSFYGALTFCIPFIQYHLWSFIAPGLYQKEKRFILPLILAFPFLFFLGGVFLFWGVLPNAFHFFFTTSQNLGKGEIPLLLSVSDYLSLLFTFLIVFGLSFQMPLLLIFLVKSSLLSLPHLISFRRYAVVLIFILAAFLTPPDVLSQIGLAIPLLALYEGSIIYLRLCEKKKEPDD